MVSHALRERGMRERITKADEAVEMVVTRAILVTARNCYVSGKTFDNGAAHTPALETSRCELLGSGPSSVAL
jgi:hypothetical protein